VTYKTYHIPVLSTLDSTSELLDAPADWADGVSESCDTGTGTAGLHVAETGIVPRGRSHGRNALQAGSGDPVGCNSGPISEDFRVGIARWEHRREHWEWCDRAIWQMSHAAVLSVPPWRLRFAPAWVSEDLVAEPSHLASHERESSGPSSRGSNAWGRGGTGAAAEGMSDEEETRYVCTRASLHRSMKDFGFSCSRRPSTYNVTRQNPSVQKQRYIFDDIVRQYRAAGRTTSYTDMTVAVGGFRGWKGRGPSAVDSTPPGRPQNIPIRASKGMTCPNLREIGSGRARGFSHVVFPTFLLLV